MWGVLYDLNDLLFFLTIVIVIVNGPFFSRYFSIFVIVIVNINNTVQHP